MDVVEMPCPYLMIHWKHATEVLYNPVLQDALDRQKYYATNQHVHLIAIIHHCCILMGGWVSKLKHNAEEIPEVSKHPNHEQSIIIS